MFRLEDRVRIMEEVVRQQSDALRESSKLLQKLRPQRPAIPHDRKLAQASEQGWKCIDPYSECPQWKLSDGTFSVAGGLLKRTTWSHGAPAFGRSEIFRFCAAFAIT